MPISVKSTKRLGYAFAGLLAGDATLLFFVLRGTILAALYKGQLYGEISIILELFAVYACASLVGWLIVGLPTALFFPSRWITGLSWPVTLLVGAALGPLALFAIFVLLARGRIHIPGAFAGTGALWVFSILVSTVSFLLYAALLRKAEHEAERN
jgi:hypothetical protein